MADNVTTTTPVSTVPTGTVIATHKGAANENYQRVQIVDGQAADGVTPALVSASFAFGMQVDVKRVTAISPGFTGDNLGKREDDPANSGDVGVMALIVRADTPAATAANGDYVPLLSDSLGQLWTNVGAVTPGTGATNLGKAEDAVAGSGDVGVMALAVRADTAAATAANGDYVPLLTDSEGKLWAKVVSPTTRITVTSGGLTTATTAYTAGDMLGTQFTFANAPRFSGGSFTIVSAVLVNASLNTGPIDLFLFTESVTQAADNAANSWSDADMAKCIGVVNFPPPTYSALNSVAVMASAPLTGIVTATSLFGGLVTRIGHTFFAATTDIQVALQIVQD